MDIAVNKDGKTLFLLDDGERWWYLGDNQQQVEKFHRDSYGDEEIEIDEIRPVTVTGAAKTMILLEEKVDGKDVKKPLLEVINDDDICYSDGVCLVASTVS